MILADTSIWIGHFRNGNNQLRELLQNNQVVIHRFIIGELALGSMKNRSEIMKLLTELPETIEAGHDEVLRLAEEKDFEDKEISWIDAHRVASALISGAKLFTIDTPLRTVAESLGIEAQWGEIAFSLNKITGTGGANSHMIFCRQRRSA